MMIGRSPLRAQGNRPPLAPPGEGAYAPGEPTPRWATGQWRYYSGLLSMMALLRLSGNFRIYEPAGQ